MPKFGISVYSISRLIMDGTITPEQAVEWLCENGAEVIEIVPFGIDFMGDPGLVSRVKQAAQKYGIPIGNYSLNANFLLITQEEYDKEIARVKAHMDIAAELGVKTFRSDSAGFRRPISENTIEKFIEELPLIAGVYDTLAAYAKQKGVTLLLENHGFHANGSERVRLILKTVKAENFGHQLDTGNYICMDESPEIAVKKMLPFATTIHMKDFYVRDEQNDPGDATQFDCSGSWFRSVGGRYLRGSILAQGDLDMKGIIRQIKASGFDGNIFIEYEGMEDCKYGTKVSLDNLKRIYAES